MDESVGHGGGGCKFPSGAGTCKFVGDLWDGVQQEAYCVACLVFWGFLLRVQSEGVPILAGAASDQEGLPADLRSSLSVAITNGRK